MMTIFVASEIALASQETHQFIGKVSSVSDPQGVLNSGGIIIIPNQTEMKFEITVDTETAILASAYNCNDLGIHDQCAVYRWDEWITSIIGLEIKSAMDTLPINSHWFRFYDRWAGCGTPECGEDLIHFNKEC